VKRPAVFLDRDGTLIEDRHYISDPDDVVLMPGAAAAVRRLHEAGFAVIVVTNQSGRARGLITPNEFVEVDKRFNALLKESGARLDGMYWCPHHPDITGPCECRKPGTLLFRAAADDHALDLSRSWYIGDKVRDILPASTLGGRGILVPGQDTPPEELAQARAEFDIAASLDEAATRIIESA
jgi:histidinol-phosphate phosphatase family protein